MIKGFFLHALRNNEIDNFIEKSSKGLFGENFNAFYIPEQIDPSVERLSTIPPRWETHTKSIIIAFDSESVVFQGGYPRNMISSRFFLDSYEENIPEKLKLIRSSKIEEDADGPKPIFSFQQYFDKVDQRKSKMKNFFSSQTFGRDIRVPSSIYYYGSLSIDKQIHDEAHIRGPLHAISKIVIYEKNLNSPEESKEQHREALNIFQKIINKRFDILIKPNKPENVKILNNFIDIEISRGTLALQKIALLLKTLKYHELNPTLDTNQEMQIAFRSKVLKSNQFLAKGPKPNSRHISVFEADLEDQKKWIDIQKRKIHDEICKIQSEIESFVQSFPNSKDIKPLKSLASSSEELIKKISDSRSQEQLNEEYDAVQKNIKSWESDARIDMGLRNHLKQIIIQNLRKPINLEILKELHVNGSQFGNFILRVEPRSFVREMASSDKNYDHAIINFGLATLLKQNEVSKIFIEEFSGLSKEKQKAILKNAVQNNNKQFIDLLIGHKSKDENFSLFSALWTGNLEEIERLIDEKMGALISRNRRANPDRYLKKNLMVLFQNDIIPFDTPLHFAAHVNNIQTIELILRKLQSADIINHKIEDGGNVLCVAIQNGSMEAFNYLRNIGVKDHDSTYIYIGCHNGYLNLLPNFVIHNSDSKVGKTPAYIAVESQHPTLARRFINNLSHYSLADKSSDRFTLIQCAAEKNDALSLTALIEKGVSEIDSEPYNTEYSSIHFAAQHGNEKTLNLLLSSNSKRFLNSYRKGRTPLVVAVINDRVGVIEILLQAINEDKKKLSKSKQIDIDRHFSDFTEEKDMKYNGLTLLHIAVLNKNYRALRLLLSSGNFDINKQAIQANSGLTPLDLAILGNSYQIVDLLLKNGAQLNQYISNNDQYNGLNSIHLACKLNKNPAIIKALISSGQIDVNSEVRYGPDQGKTALELSKDISVVEALLKMGADPEKIYSSGEKPLQRAIKESNSRKAEVLIKAGAIFDPNFVDQLSFEDFVGLLRSAINNDCFELTDRILHTKIFDELKANKNEAFKELIHHLISNKKNKMLEFILDKLNLNVDEDYTIGGVNLLERAITTNNSEATKILIERKANIDNPFQSGLRPIEAAIKNIDLRKVILEANPNLLELSESSRITLFYITINDTERAISLFDSLSEEFIKSNEIGYRGLTPLQYAIKENKKEVIRYLISRDDYLDGLGEKKVPLRTLYMATSIDDIELLDKLLKRGRDINYKFEGGNAKGLSLIALCLQNKNIKGAKFLLEQGASLDLEIKEGDFQGFNIFQLAINTNIYDEELLLKLLERDGSWIDKKTPADSRLKMPDLTPLNMSIILKPNSEISKFLLEKGAEFASVITEGKHKGLDSLSLAISLKNNEIANELLSRGASPHFIAQSGEFEGLDALQIAIKTGNTEIVASLLKKGARFDRVILSGECIHHSALDMAIIEKNNAIANLFMEDSKQFDQFDLKSLIFKTHLSIKHENKKMFEFIIEKIIEKSGGEALNLLKDHDILIHVSNIANLEMLDVLAEKFDISQLFKKRINDKFSVFQTVLFESRYDFVNKLMQFNVDIEEKIVDPNSSYHGLTALQIATKNSDIKMMKILLKKANVNALSLGKSSALHMAIENNNIEAINILMERQDLDPTIVNADGLNAFHLAVKHKNIKVLEILLQQGRVNIDSVIEDGPFKGLTALQMAIANDDRNVARFLLEKKANLNKIVDSGPFAGFSTIHFCSGATGSHHVTLRFLEKLPKKLLNQPLDQNEAIKDGILQGMNLRDIEILKEELCSEDDKSTLKLIEKIEELGIEKGQRLQEKLQEIIRIRDEREEMRNSRWLESFRRPGQAGSHSQISQFQPQPQPDLIGMNAQYPNPTQQFGFQQPQHQVGSQSQIFSYRDQISHGFVSSQIQQQGVQVPQQQLASNPTQAQRKKRPAGNISVAVPAVVIQQTFQNDIANPSVVPQKPTGSSVQNQGADNSRPSEDKSSKRARS